MHNLFWKKNIYWLLWLCLITYLSNAKGSGIPKLSILAFEGADKLVHAVFYLVLILLMNFGFVNQQKYPKLNSSNFLYSFLFTASWGILMELSQLLIFTYRTAEWADLAANILGATTGLLMSTYLWKLNNNS